MRRVLARFLAGLLLCEMLVPAINVEADWYCTTGIYNDFQTEQNKPVIQQTGKDEYFLQTELGERYAVGKVAVKATKNAVAEVAERYGLQQETIEALNQIVSSYDNRERFDRPMITVYSPSLLVDINRGSTYYTYKGHQMMQEMITTEGDSTGFVTVSSGSAAVKALKTLTYAVFTAASVADLKVALTAAAISVYSYICNQTGHTPIANGGNYVQCNVKFNKYVRLTYVKENGSYHIGAKTEQIELIRLVTRTHTAYQKSSSVIAFDDIEIDRASSKLFASSHFNSADSVAISHYLSPTPYEEIVYVSLGSVRRSLQ